MAAAEHGRAEVATSATDESAYGDLFQWGRWDDGHQKRNSQTTADLPEPNNPAGLGEGSPLFYTADPEWWNSAPEASDRWAAPTIAEVSDTNGCDPCKAMGEGWRLPTEDEWTNVIAAENITNIATAFESNLKLTVAGSRSSSGNIASPGVRGYYWSSTVSAPNLNFCKYLFYSNLSMNPHAGGFREQGSSVRCIQEATAGVKGTWA